MNEHTIEFIHKRDPERWGYLIGFLRTQQGYAGLFTDADLTPLAEDERVLFYDYCWLYNLQGFDSLLLPCLVMIRDVEQPYTCCLRRNHKGPHVAWDDTRGLIAISR